MNYLTRLFVWLRRIGHCRGFGIQSPTDYQFVRYVINEHWPYYAYDEFTDTDWLRNKLGRLYFRVANWRQPTCIVDAVGAAEYLKAGCRKAHINNDTSLTEMACIPISYDYQTLFSHCNDRSVVIVQDIWKQTERWHAIEHTPQVTVSYDLYYCGIVLFDSKRTKQSYIINF